MYGLTLNGKLYRLTFSKSLAEFLAKDKYEIRIFKVIQGGEIPKDAISSSGLYGIVSSKSHKLLRLSLSKDFANFICRDKFRYLIECWLVPVA